MTADPVPNLYLAGVEKAGTSFLYDLLAQHPKIFAPSEKEPRFFLEGISRDQVRFGWSKILGWTDYLALFKEHAGRPYLLDGSPQYFYYDEAIRRISLKTEGSARLVVVLRDPIGRAYSHYQMMYSNGGVPRLSFSELFSRSTDGSHPFFETADDYRHVFTRGLYSSYLTDMLRVFPREQVLCLIFEDLKLDWGQACSRIFEFLDLEDYSVDLSLSRRNASYEVKGVLGRSLVSWSQRLGHFVKQVLPIAAYDRVKNGVMRAGEVLGRLEPSAPLSDWDRLDEMKAYYAPDVEKLSEVLGVRPRWLEQKQQAASR